MKWSINTAPRDGTRFLAWFTNPEFGTAVEFPVISNYYSHSFYGDCWEWGDGYTAKIEDVTGFWTELPVLDTTNRQSKE